MKSSLPSLFVRAVLCSGAFVVNISPQAAYQSAVGDIRASFPTYDEPLALFENLRSMTAVQKAVVLLEPNYIDQVLEEFTARDLDGSGILDEGELFAALDEFNGSQRELSACLATCAEAFASRSNEGESTVVSTTTTANTSTTAGVALAASAAFREPPNADEDADTITDECTALGYLAMRAAFDTHCQELDVDEVALVENMLYERVDDLERSGDPVADLGLQVDSGGIILD
mmetsp:Transcript_33530/g.68554  ORF Transcript_33530/g.68554 Transcript_33530/m.68554 type:complete len:231 (-) Transcript_33530:96-788(-)